MKTNSEGNLPLTSQLGNVFSFPFPVDILNVYVSEVMCVLKTSHFSHTRVLQFMHTGESSFIQPHNTKNSGAVS
jgi:hypothetical protein